MYTCRYCKAEHHEPVKFCTKCGMKMKYDEENPVSSSSSKQEKDHQKNEPEKNTAPSHPDKDQQFENSKTEEEKKADSEVQNSSQQQDEKDEPEEDPFVYKFDSGSEGPKKSGDGVWLAIVAIVVVIAIIIIGTSRKNSQEEKAEQVTNESSETSIIDDVSSNETIDNNNTEEASGDQVVTDSTQEESVAPPGPSEEASSTLVDYSAYKFDYSPKQVIDKDFSTAWIEAERDAGIGEYIMVNFGDEKEMSRIGIVPGYGRDETIFFENNRVKKLTITFSDGTSIQKELDDRYGMHMIEFDQKKTSSINITIEEVYSGSKYNDTAISEIDVDSDYVKNNDPDGAMRYYVENKKANAKQPK